MSHMVHPTNRNTLQELSERTGGVVTPANILDVVSLPFTIQGLRHLDSWGGMTQAAMGFAEDLVNGPLARSTGTANEVGRKLDPILDKVKLLYALSKIWQGGQAPKPLLVAVASQNLANAAIALYDPQVEVSRSGKRALFMMQSGIALAVFGAKVAETRPVSGRALRIGGSVLGAAGVLRGGKATFGYLRQAQAHRHFHA